MKIFISHNSIDKPFVRQLADSLSIAGIESWIDEAEIKYGESLIHKIADAIEELDVVFAIISKNSIDSSWVKKELSLAMTKEITIGKIVVIPIVIDNCDIPFFLRDKLYANFTDTSSYDRNINKLIDSINYHVGTKKKKISKDKLLGTTITKTHKPLYFQFVTSVLIIAFAIILSLAVYFFGKTDRIWSTYNEFSQRVYVFCLLLFATQLAEIISDLMKYSVIKIDPNFADESRNIVISSVLIKRYRNVLKKYWKYPLLKIATFIEITMWIFCYPFMVLLVFEIALDVILKK